MNNLGQPVFENGDLIERGCQFSGEFMLIANKEMGTSLLVKDGKQWNFFGFVCWNGYNATNGTIETDHGYYDIKFKNETVLRSFFEEIVLPIEQSVYKLPKTSTSRIKIA